MYKISEVASMLNVEKVVIFEKLISKAREIEPHISKEKGITYFSPFGVEVMNALIYGGPLPVEEETDGMVTSNSSEIDLENDEYISTEDIQRINEERAKIKKKIMVCRNKLIELDGQHRQIDEVLKHYQEMMKEDADWIRIAESKMAYRMNLNEAKR